MNAKKSLSAGIIAIIFSVGGLIFNGIYGLFYLIINDISEAVENKGTFALTTIILVLMAILMLLYISNIVFPYHIIVQPFHDNVYYTNLFLYSISIV